MKRNRNLWGILAALCALTIVAAWATPALAQAAPMEKAPMYSYVGNWTIPRPQWADMEKNDAADQAILAKALADGTLVGYGSDMNLVHQVDGATHDSWWSAMSMAGILSVLDKFYKSGSATAPVMASATRHWDEIAVSKYYNWHSGTFKGAYTRVGQYKLKADAPNDAVDTLSKTVVVPLMEKLLASGTIVEYEVDTEAVHTMDPGTFWIVLITPNADGMDKFDAALRDATKTNPLIGPAFGSMVDFSAHRDYLSSSTVTYK